MAKTPQQKRLHVSAHHGYPIANCPLCRNKAEQEYDRAGKLARSAIRKANQPRARTRGSEE